MEGIDLYGRTNLNIQSTANHSDLLYGSYISKYKNTKFNQEPVKMMFSIHYNNFILILFFF